jgi:hypothetical protein
MKEGHRKRKKELEPKIEIKRDIVEIDVEIDR